MKKFQISNFKFQISKSIKNWKLEIGNSPFNGAGFTLIELLTSVALFTVIGVIGISMLTFTLRGGKKTDAIENIRRSGDIALLSMVRNIRYAKSIDDCTDGVSSPELQVTSLSGEQTTYSCTAVPDAVSVNGVSLIDTNTVIAENCSFTCRMPSGNASPSISIQFTLSSKDSTGLFENKVSIPFQTNVSVRNAGQQ